MKKMSFTLVELLIVMAIIGILAAMLIPTLKSAKDTAKTVQCLGNLKQMYLGLMPYSENYDDVVCPAYIQVFRNNWPNVGDDHFGNVTKPTGDEGWLTFDEIYMNEIGKPTTGWGEGGTPRAVQCPKGPWFLKIELNIWVPESINNLKAGHYAINAKTGSPNGPPEEYVGSSWVCSSSPGWNSSTGNYDLPSVNDKYGEKRRSQWMNPAGTIFIAESARNYGWSNAWNSGQGAPVMGYLVSGYAWGNLDTEAQWQRKHFGKMSTLFSDGHVGNYKPEETVGTGNMGLYWIDGGVKGVRGMWTDIPGD